MAVASIPAKPSFVLERVLLGEVDHVQREIDVQVGPMKMVLGMPFYMAYLREGPVGKPRKMLVWQVVFLAVDVQPNAAGVSVSHLNDRSARARRL